ncbi:MAG: LysR family transcriptional regulator [Pseudomonadota bacterium]
MRRPPPLNWIRLFEAVGRTGSFARAGAELGISGPAVSQQIRALETHLGEALFERGPRSVTLTPAGRAFLPKAAHGLRAIEGSVEALFGGRRGERLSLQVALAFGAGWLAPRLLAFATAHPGIALQIATGVHPDDFARRGAELQVTFASPPGPGEDGEALFGEQLLPVGLPGLVAQVRGPEDLVGLVLIEIASNRNGWHDFLPEDAPPPRMVHVDNTLTAFALAASGLGLALARAPVTDAMMAIHGLVPCPAFAPVTGVDGYFLVHPATARLSRPASAFRDWLLAQAAAEKGP